MKKFIAYLSIFFFCTISVRAQTSEVFKTDGKAIKGYDAVAFFKQGKAVKGNDSLSYNWNDAAWFFSDKANLDSFKTNPQAYAPQYGGYCAYGTAEGHKAPTATDTWTIVDGKLYFNYNGDVKKMWLKDEAALIKKADANWQLIKDKE